MFKPGQEKNKKINLFVRDENVHLLKFENLRQIAF